MKFLVHYTEIIIMIAKPSLEIPAATLAYKELKNNENIV